MSDFWFWMLDFRLKNIVFFSILAFGFLDFGCSYIFLYFGSTIIGIYIYILYIYYIYTQFHKKTIKKTHTNRALFSGYMSFFQKKKPLREAPQRIWDFYTQNPKIQKKIQNFKIKNPTSDIKNPSWNTKNTISKIQNRKFPFFFQKCRKFSNWKSGILEGIPMHFEVYLIYFWYIFDILFL